MKMVREYFLEATSRIAQYTIHTAYNTQQQDTCHASHQADTHGASVLEGRYRLFVRSNEHCLDDEQIVIQGDDGIDQSNEYHQPMSAVECSSKHEELAEESGERRNTCQGEQGQSHDHGQLWVGLVQAVVVGALQFTVSMMFYGSNDTEYS